MRPFVEALLAELLARHRPTGSVHLDDLAEVIGERAVSYEEVEYLVVALEEAGLRVGEPLDEREVSVVREVLAAARALRDRHGRSPTVDELAEATGQPAHAVRRALESAATGNRPHHA